MTAGVYQLFIFGILGIIAISLYVLYKHLKDVYPSIFDHTIVEIILFMVAMFGGIVLYAYANDCVAVVYTIEKPGNYDSEVIFGDYYDSTKGDVTIHFPVEKAGHYVCNMSDDTAVLYPVAYGTASLENKELSIIEGRKITKLPTKPDYFFAGVPESIKVNKDTKGEVKYAIDWIENIVK